MRRRLLDRIEVARRIQTLPLEQQVEAASAALRLYGERAPSSRFSELSPEEQDELADYARRLRFAGGGFDLDRLDDFDEHELERFDALLEAVGLTSADRERENGPLGLGVAVRRAAPKAEPWAIERAVEIGLDAIGEAVAARDSAPVHVIM